MATDFDLETPEQMRGFIAHVVAGMAGGEESSWRTLVGPVERLPTWKYVRFNWSVKPNGTGEQRAIIKKAVEIVRTAHPYIH